MREPVWKTQAERWAARKKTVRTNRNFAFEYEIAGERWSSYRYEKMRSEWTRRVQRTYGTYIAASSRLIAAYSTTSTGTAARNSTSGQKTTAHVSREKIDVRRSCSPLSWEMSASVTTFPLGRVGSGPTRSPPELAVELRRLSSVGGGDDRAGVRCCGLLSRTCATEGGRLPRAFEHTS